MTEGFHAVADEVTLEKVLGLAKSDKSTPRSADGEIELSFKSYLSQIVRYATGEDRNWDEPHTLFDRALGAWRESEKRLPGKPVISLALETADDWRATNLVLEITTDDQPFLVDSVSGLLAEIGTPVSFFINAVVDTRRDTEGNRVSGSAGNALRESMIHVEMDPPADNAAIERIRSELERVLRDVSLAVSDWEPMRARLGACIAQLERARPQNVAREDLRDSVDFLKWLWDNRFAFLGVRRYGYMRQNSDVSFKHEKDQDLGIARDTQRRIMRSTFTPDGEVSPASADFMNSAEPIIIAKANAKSTVHRRVPLDYIGVKMYSVDGQVVGEELFIGLFTADAYQRTATDIPLLRSKVQKVVEGAGFVPGGHNEKALVNILETFPRDELFQSDINSLREFAFGILRLFKRPRTKVFLRRDRLDRFVSALVYVPRDRFSSSVRKNIGEVLAAAFDGEVASFTPYFGDAALVRVHFIITIEPGAPEGPGLAELTRRVRDLTHNWSDDLLAAMRLKLDGAAPGSVFSKYENAFDAGYRENTSAYDALNDISVLEEIGNDQFAVRVFQPSTADSKSLNIKLYNRNGPRSLSELIPRIENLGLDVIQEAGASVRAEGVDHFWIHNFTTREKHGRLIDVSAIAKALESAFEAVLKGKTDDDGFNALVVVAGLDWREAWLLRAIAKHIQQIGFPYSQAYIEECLSKHPEAASALVAAFHARFNPLGAETLDDRRSEYDEARSRALEVLEKVESLDEDRIIRRFIEVFDVMLRTNYYQRTNDGDFKPYISYKVLTEKLAETPEPKPFREIYVSGPRVDGVHLRFGPIARGGLRWSDRREDFRTEVLGLVKAQRVKNAVIVPTGAKGCFYPKLLPTTGDRNEYNEAGREAYKEFIRGLLDITDNYDRGEIVAPKSVVRWDDVDPYLVVAADKGTAAFSDTANSISNDYGFWLGDAFASGGSAGYDHKVMGITAKGAWEAVKRHFREIGKDIQSEPFTVAGVGDMSGDVFGNGMLLSKQIKLIAAFDHRDIFIDPDPDPAKSWDERKRLFDTPRTSWQDYKADLISKGGGVYSRKSKSIKLSKEAQHALGITKTEAAPSEIIKAILKSEVELFWLGGIGTYFKAPEEEHAAANDRSNDAFRINADEMRMKVVGEGANLGLTQNARIVYARTGGRINTDAIDNSAGVDSSDHEVNIKILLSTAIEKREFKAEDRDQLLRDMTENVAKHVLRHNYDQTRAISLMSATAAEDIDAYQRMMHALESKGRLDRNVENLPDDRTIAGLASNGAGLSRPELSVLLAYAKLHLFDELVGSKAPDDAVLERELFSYFPEQLRGFKQSMVDHRLRREIIATRLSNEIIDTCGATFPNDMIEATGASFEALALAYEGARQILHLDSYAANVDNLDNQISANTQTLLYRTATNLISEQVYKILGNVSASTLLTRNGIEGLVDQYRDAIDELKTELPSILSSGANEDLQARLHAWKKAGAPEELAREAAMMPALEFAFDIVNLARQSERPAVQMGALFFKVGDRLKIEDARQAARSGAVDNHFDRLALRRIEEELSISQSNIAANIAKLIPDAPVDTNAAWADGAVKDWRKKHSAAVEQTERFIGDLQLETGITVGKLALLSRKLGDLVERTRV